MMESGFPVIAITDAPCRFAAFTDAATTSVVPEKEKATTTSSFVMISRSALLLPHLLR